MGYSISGGGEVIIRAANQKAALEAIRAEGLDLGRGDTLADALGDLSDFDWHATIDATTGDVVWLEYPYQKCSGTEDDVLATLAPFVEPGGYIDWEGEEGDRWRDEFTGDGQIVTTRGETYYGDADRGRGLMVWCVIKTSEAGPEVVGVYTSEAEAEEVGKDFHMLLGSEYGTVGYYVDGPTEIGSRELLAEF